MDELLRVAETARILRLSRAKVYELLAAQEIRSVKIGAARRIPRSDLNDFIRRLKDV